MEYPEELLIETRAAVRAAIGTAETDDKNAAFFAWRAQRLMFAAEEYHENYWERANAL